MSEMNDTDRLLLLERILRCDVFDGGDFDRCPIARFSPADKQFVIYARQDNTQFFGNSLRDVLNKANRNLPPLKQMTARDLLDELIERVGPEGSEGSCDHIICADGTVYNFQIRRQDP